MPSEKGRENIPAFTLELEQINFETLHSELAAKINFAYSSLALRALVAAVS